MSNVTITVDVDRKAMLPRVQVLVGLDQNNDGAILGAELVYATEGSDGKFSATLAGTAKTTCAWAVVITAPHSSTYTVHVVSDSGATDEGEGSVGPSNNAMMRNKIAL